MKSNKTDNNKKVCFINGRGYKMAGLKKLPIGIENFEKLRQEDFYYIDKTRLIEQLLTRWGEVNLFTRPRRFGKSLNMSMLQSFFEIGKDKTLFDGLRISDNQELCEEYQGKFPVVSFSLKGINGATYEEARRFLIKTINEEARRLSVLSDSAELDETDHELLTQLKKKEMTNDSLVYSIRELTELLEKHYGRKVIVLIDEYDVPLAKANENGYYDEMVLLIRNLFENALKTNSSLKFAVLTGCLRIAKESIFTGTNNFVSDTITDSRLSEYFGFMQREVDQILKDGDIEDKADSIKEWYDGYHFGEFDIYCPWDVMNYLLELQRNPKAKPVSYWKNTSDNAIIQSFIDYAGNSITKKLETLMSGGYIIQRVDESLTYDYLHSSEDNLWSLLYLTGYLTKAREEDHAGELPEGTVALIIPNAEIKEIFETTVIQWFEDSAKKWNRNALFDAVWKGDSEGLTREMSCLLKKTISYHDYKEDFYHAFLAGIFAGAGYMVDSNKGHGEGRSDVVVDDPANGRIAIFEAKYTKELDDLERTCDKALQQIDDRMYAEEYKDDYDQILCYGISFFKKRCRVKKK